MYAIVQNNYSKETHSWNWYIPTGATKLLIGTFPSNKRNRKYDFFYCSSTNRFWEVFSSIAKHPIELLHGRAGVEERKKILDSLGLGLTDMGKIVYRQQGSSKDHSLFPDQFMDITYIFNKYPSIETLIVSGKNQGNSSLSWFNIFCSLNDIKINVKQLETQKSTEIVIAEKKVKLLVAFSPSRLSRITTDTLMENYSSLFLTEIRRDAGFK